MPRTLANRFRGHSLVCAGVDPAAALEGKSSPRRGRRVDLSTMSSPSLTPTRERILDALVDVSMSPAAAAVLGLSPGQVDEIGRNAALRSSPTMRADRVYSGVLYDALSFGSLSTAARRRATSRVAITSSLFGLVRPDDRIPAYRLSGDVRLPGPDPSRESGAPTSAGRSLTPWAAACWSTSGRRCTPPSGGRLPT